MTVVKRTKTLVALLVTAAVAFPGEALASAAGTDRWRPLIAEASARCGIPEHWIERVMRAEIAGRTRVARGSARGPSGA